MTEFDTHDDKDDNNTNNVFQLTLAVHSNISLSVRLKFSRQAEGNKMLRAPRGHISGLPV
jgi:hypothetical protein